MDKEPGVINPEQAFDPETEDSFEDEEDIVWVMPTQEDLEETPVSKHTDELPDEQKIVEYAKKLGEENPGISTAYANFALEVGKYPLLTPDEEKELSKRILDHKDPEAFEKFVMSNLRLAIACVRDIQNRSGNNSILDFMDLVQEAIMGLMIAVDRFDYRKNCRFSTYGIRWIHQRIKRAMAKHKSGISVPGFAGESANVLSKYIDMYRNGKTEDIPEKIRKRVKNLSRINAPTISISEDGEDGAVIDVNRFSPPQSDQSEEDIVTANIFREEFLGKIHDLVKDEPDGDLKFNMLCRRFGFPPYTIPQTLSQIGDEVKRSQEYVRIELDNLIKKFRKSADIKTFYIQWRSDPEVPEEDAPTAKKQKK